MGTLVQCLLVITILAKVSSVWSLERPNIVLVVADDLGWGDVGWHNPQMVDVTRGLSRLAREGITLNQYYVQQVCSPSRSALLTGMYPYHIGRQKRTIKVRGEISPVLTFLSPASAAHWTDPQQDSPV